MGFDARPHGPSVKEVEPGSGAGGDGRPGIEVAGERYAAGANQQVQALALVAAALLNDGAQAAEPAALVLLG